MSLASAAGRPGADDVGYNDFLHGVGWHLDRRKFGAFLAERAAQSGAEVRRGTRFVAAEREADGTLAVLLQTGEGLDRVPARFVVDATGIHSRFAKAMGARPLLHDRLLWIGGVLDRPVDRQPSRLTMIEAVEYGWWYAASVPDGRTIVGAITDTEINRLIALHRPGRWRLHLEKTRHMAGWLAECRFGGDRLTIRPAPAFVLDRVCGNDWLAVGDAAAAYDPIASQGIHKALSDGLLSAAAIAGHLAGIRSALDGYAASVAAGFADYLNNRNHFYDAERRWPASTFWQNRARASSDALAAAHEQHDPAGAHGVDRHLAEGVELDP